MSNFIRLFSFAEDDGEDEDVEREQPPRPQWLAPPEDELGAAVSLGLVVARSDMGVVALPHVTVYSTGLSLDVVAVARGLTDAQSSRLFHEQHLFEQGEEPPSGFLRIGLELPDGARVSNLGGRMGRRRRLMKPDEEPDGPIFMEAGGGGGSAGGGHVSMNPGFWLWPLPGPGTMRVFCEWPVVEIPLSTVDVDTAELIAATERIVPLWPASTG